MKRWMIAALMVLATGHVYAQKTCITDVFKLMPDSIMPYLSVNNRLDFVDFLESGMKAEVRNQLGGISEMTALTEDSLSIKMNDALKVDMLLMRLDEPVDTINQIVVVIETFMTDSIYGESSVSIYTPEWQCITKRQIPLNQEQRQRIGRTRMQNILKWKEDKLNKS